MIRHQLTIRIVLGSLLIAGLLGTILWAQPLAARPATLRLSSGVLGGPHSPAAPTGSSFTYQGTLTDGPGPANGTYDFQFSLWFSASGGSPAGSVLTLTGQAVNNGLFQVPLDFGADAFRGDERWVQIAVQQNNGGYRVLTPRQPVTATPYAMSLIPGSGIISSLDNLLFIAINTGSGDGILGRAGTNKSGIWGDNTSNGRGVDGTSVSGPGVRGHSISGLGVYGSSDTGDGVIGRAGANRSGVWGDNTSNGRGVEGTSIGGPGVRGHSVSDLGVYGSSDTGDGIVGQASGSTKSGVAGNNSGSGNGVYGSSVNGSAVAGGSTSGYGIYGTSTCGDGIRGEIANSNSAVGGVNTGTGTGVYGSSTSGRAVAGVSVSGTGVYGTSVSGAAGRFEGNVQVTGNLTKGGGSFKIDDPLDPANKYLYHSFVESPDMKNIYDGVVVLDATGSAWVTLPEWFQALNRDFRYQLTPMGAPMADLYIAQEIEQNRFQIAGGEPGRKVSWQVTGIRQDPYANRYRIPVEQDKPAAERGSYLHPELYDQPAPQLVGPVRPLGPVRP